MNKVQTAAYELIQSDARFIYTLIDINKKAKNINSNYILMCLPYIGIFTYGAEQWCNRAGLKSPTFSKSEKEYYIALRQSHKLFEKNYADYSGLLMRHLEISDAYFYKIRSPLAKLVGYYNVGTDLCNGRYCGNTLLCGAYNPIPTINNPYAGVKLRNFSIIAGRLAAFFMNCSEFPIYQYDDKANIVRYKDYHFFDNCPIKQKNELGVVLFSILCSINYITTFIENYFKEEIPQKFKFAYLQYYYLCDFIGELNALKGLRFVVDDSLKCRDLRNCLAHYGLQQLMKEEDVLESDILKGLTVKTFHLEYNEAKLQIFEILNNLRDQISEIIF